MGDVTAPSAPRRAGLPAHEVVYRRLRDMVLFGDMLPGQPVTIQGLVDELGAGMTPVREALRRLTTEGALEALGNRRIAVPVLDRTALEELTLGRLALEPMLAERATMRVGKTDIAALENIDAQLDSAILSGDVQAYLRQNHKFHACLNARAEAPVLAGLVEALWLRFGPSMRVVCGQFGTRNLPDLHKDLITALKTGDGHAAAAAVAQDVRQGAALVTQGLAG